MTGEVTLRGKVIGVGGVRDKVLAASRAGMKTVVLPEENRADLDDLPDSVRESLDIHLVRDMFQALDVALLTDPRGLAVAYTHDPFVEH